MQKPEHALHRSQQWLEEEVGWEGEVDQEAEEEVGDITGTESPRCEAGSWDKLEF